MKFGTLFALLFILKNTSISLLAQDKRPNIVFILTDDQRWDALGYAGNEIIKTPEMDRLASEGVYFKNAFVTTPICAASRVSIITGLYERKHQYTFQQPPIDSTLVDHSYFSVLKNADYYNGFLGKMGVNFKDDLEATLFDFYRPENQSHYYKIVDGEHKHVTDCIGDNAVEFIESAPSEQPFCLSISFHAPHAIDNSPQQYIWPSSVDAIGDDLIIPEPMMGEQKYFEELPENVKNGFNRTRWKWRYNTREKYQKMVKGYYNMINGVDQNIGKIREALQAKGVADNTIIILLGDNGYFLGERQIAGKWLMYEHSLRVPLIINNPIQSYHRDVNDMVLNIDIAPTILDIADVKGKISHGQSLLPYAEDQNDFSNDRDFFLCEHLWDFDHIPPSEGVRSREYKYIRYINNPEIEELYNLEDDPFESVNLINNPNIKELLSDLRFKCDQLSIIASQ